MIVMRTIPFEVPTFEKLQLPNVLRSIAESERGMILVTGVRGSGKSSTMAALIHHINTTMSKHIVMLENPIKFLHRDLNSSVTQREVGSDTASFEMGLSAALRQDPDVVLIDELRDAEMIDTAMRVAETGHVLISTLHTPDATGTVARTVAMFPPQEQEVARVRLADVLQAVISQRLLPRADGEGRCAALEVLICTANVRELIRDRNRVGEIKDYIADARQEYGMQTFDQHLVELVEQGAVAFETAEAAASNPADFQVKVRSLGQRAKGRKSKRQTGSG